MYEMFVDHNCCVLLKKTSSLGKFSLVDVVQFQVHVAAEEDLQVQDVPFIRMFV